jgi:decaprenyl-phosphate phosphoribosyltransferase
MRPRQWSKNLLVFAAPLAAGDVLETDVLLPTLVSFAAFILASSGTYLVNDVRDAATDRRHPDKSRRPVAAGHLSARVAVIAGVSLMVAGIALSFAADARLALVVALYVLATLAYSLGLKNAPVLELALLSAGFLLRAVAGGVAAGIPLSPWFLLVAGFGSLSIAAGKRYAELKSAVADPVAHRSSLEGYTPDYLRFVWIVATSVLITTYCLWVVEVGQPGSSVPWALLSAVPFVLAVLRFGVDVDAGRTQAPEEAIYRDPALLGLALIWLLLFSAGAFGLDL